MPLLALACAAICQAQPAARALRIAEPPLVDGRLDDPCWTTALPIGDLLQVEPVQGARPSFPTEVRIVYDADTLYVGVRCFDAEPGQILARQLERDAQLDPDDRVEIFFDTFHDKRNAFWFQMNPAGDMGDALVTNNGQDFNKPWDGIWEGRASIDGQGYSLEFALPFKTLNFKEGLDTWGFNVRRLLKRKNEESRWAAPRQDINFFQVSQAGDLTGLTGMRQGIGLDVTPFFVGRWNEGASGGDDQDLLGKPGVDMLYKITPSLNALLTVNTDFADTEVDERVIDLTRFPLFFPEKRDFFLQDAGLFKFADLGSDLIPFFSRRIGLDEEGELVPILAGAKLTGRHGAYNIGLLDVETAATDSVEEQNLLAARISRNIGEQSTVGAIFTNGNPDGGTANQLYGFDANYRSSSFLGDKNLNSSAWVLGSVTEGDPGDDHAFGASVRYPNDLWEWAATFKEIQDDFKPELGFVPRTGIRKYTGELTYNPRPHSWIRQLEFGTESEVVTDLGGQLESYEIGFQPLGMALESGDELKLQVIPTYDRLEEEFEISEGVNIPAGEYEWTRVRLELETALKRPVSGFLAASSGDFYEGTLLDFEGGFTWRPSSRFNGSISYAESRVSLPQGDFIARVAESRINLTFSPTLSWSNFLQWDNESDSFGLNSRLRWIIAPGREARLVFNQTLEQDESGAVSPGFQELALKLEYTLRL